jgi:tRNA (cmo5U34)-methyltransferase
MAQFHWDPDGYREMMLREVPLYERLQDEVAAAACVVPARAILELGTGTGETSRRVLAGQPRARLVGIDASAEMIERARDVLPAERTALERRRLEDPLPAGPFDLVISALAVHHLNAEAKADLFRRVAAALAPGGRFVLADVVVPDDPADAVTPIDPGYDLPSRVDEQLAWLAAADLAGAIAWQSGDLAVLVADRAG